MTLISTRVPTVHVEELHTRLGYDAPINYPATSRTKPLSNWKMEVDDSPIFRYLYRHHKPRRHLEFGTWQGSGTLYCLEECQATVWTINLPFGEEDKPGDLPAYANDIREAEAVRAWAGKLGLAREKDFYWTDRLGFIGRHYLERKLGNRVCQIYCDSRDWDISQFPPGFFDSVLIDGGHTPEVVISDTRKALQLAGPGSLIIWHDYCPDPDVLSRFAQPRELVETIHANLHWIKPQLSDVFWIEPSWMLVGVKRGHQNGAPGFLQTLLKRLR